jgi:hypothetical protein
MSSLTDEIARRRTFAIISHPDAGKTTLTEKLLLFGGAIQLAGEVKARRGRRRARSDWVAIERQRGISVSAAVMTIACGITGSTINRRPTIAVRGLRDDASPQKRHDAPSDPGGVPAEIDRLSISIASWA